MREKKKHRQQRDAVDRCYSSLSLARSFHRQAEVDIAASHYQKDDNKVRNSVG
jgi:hypothetical protein